MGKAGDDDEAIYRIRYAASYRWGLAQFDALLKAGELCMPAGVQRYIFKTKWADTIAQEDLRNFAASRGDDIDVSRYS